MSPEQIDAGYEWETANVIIERFKGIDPTQVCAVLVHNHGPFVWGPSGRRAVENALALEIVAEMAPKTLLLNQGIAPNSAAVARQAFPAQTRCKRLLRPTCRWVIKVS